MTFSRSKYTDRHVFDTVTEIKAGSTGVTKSNRLPK